MTGQLCMKAALGALLVVGPGLAPAEGKKGPKAPSDRDRLQGTWTVVSLEVNGKLDKNDVGKTLKIEGDRLLPQGLEDAKLALRLAPGKAPKEFEVLDMEGKVVLKGIYKLGGNTLTACYPAGPNAQERPKDFSGAEGRKQVLLAAKRDRETAK